MALEFRLPDIGEGLAEAEVVRWLIEVGGEVAMDQAVVELETDKAVTEIPAPRAGVLLHQGAAVGEIIEIESLLMVIGDPGETWEPGSARAAVVEVPIQRVAEAAPIVGTLEESAPSGMTEALPQVRRLAAELGLDLVGISGSGPGGRITREDVEAAAGTSVPVERVRLSPIRRTIARNLTRSWQQIPHVTTYAEADAASLLEERAALAATGIPIPLEALVIEAVTPLLVEYPEFNAGLDGDDLVLRKHYDVGFAVDTADGLMVAVVRTADSLSVEQIGDEVVRLASAAKNRTIDAAEMRGATFTVSNIGAVGGGYGTPVIPWGTTAILSIGRADPKPVVVDGVIAIGRRFPLSLSYDHRVIDGAMGRRFLTGVVAAIEEVGR
ncbi:2-oxo acid dehydrogenase subunit E2 [bacterium]|nr:2-oxo acid dehydrogenase subunit E2 [bacterium]